MRRLYKNKSRNCPFSDDFLEGYNSGTEVQFEADVKVLWNIKNEITMLHFFNRENVVEIIDNHINGKEKEYEG